MENKFKTTTNVNEIIKRRKTEKNVIYYRDINES